MDCAKVGQLILQLRREKGLTQRQLADTLGISNKTVSKWECGRGAPDVSLWRELSSVLGADLLRLLQGELAPNRPDAGKMGRMRFYVCPRCGNILTSTGKASISCCGRALAPLEAARETGGHRLAAEEMDGEWYVTIQHPMTKGHYIAFAACVSDAQVWMHRLYPEQSPAFRLAALPRGPVCICIAPVTGCSAMRRPLKSRFSEIARTAKRGIAADSLPSPAFLHQSP